MFCLLVITGGEPLVRPDILDIARHAVKLGFMVVFGTNGMLINDGMAKDLVEIGRPVARDQGLRIGRCRRLAEEEDDFHRTVRFDLDGGLKSAAGIEAGADPL